ncbi:GIY-YIG nuclease family protein [Psychroserpens sp.]|jgi:putative endonuclease|uniref:GIY-YIG nuclease family protein n=1 Tax=Psychroserpens sp. TaxID=2020870 RepID=UPI0039E6C18F
MKFYYVYLLQCSDDSIYTGMTNSIDRRLEEHRIGLNPDCYTFRKRPLKLIFHQEFIQFNQAEYYEKKIKKWSRSKKLALANEDFELLKDLSICKNDTNYKNFKK